MSGTEGNEPLPDRMMENFTDAYMSHYGLPELNISVIWSHLVEEKNFPGATV